MNGAFVSGSLTGSLDGWTTYTTTDGTTGNGYPQVAQFDAEQAGSPQECAEFQVGNTVNDGSEQGAGLSQMVDLPGGDFTFSAAIASYAPHIGNSDAGTYTLLFDGTAVASFSMGGISTGGTDYPAQGNSYISGTISNVLPGQYEVAIEIDRTFSSTSFSPVEFVTDVSLVGGDSVPEPGVAVSLILGFAVIMIRPRAKRFMVRRWQHRVRS